MGTQSNQAGGATSARDVVGKQPQKHIPPRPLPAPPPLENQDLHERVDMLQQQADEAQTPSSKRRRPITAGYLADNWPRLNRPALLVNPDARPEDLLAWCWGELMSLIAAAQVASETHDNLSSGDVAAIFLHRLEPLGSMLDHAIQQLAVVLPPAANQDDDNGSAS